MVISLPTEKEAVCQTVGLLATALTLRSIREPTGKTGPAVDKFESPQPDGLGDEDQTPLAATRWLSKIRFLRSASVE